MTPSFLTAVVLLALGTLTAGPVARWLDITADKLPLPLKSPLTQLDVSRLGPYRVIERQVLEPSMVEALGTDQYLLWGLEDTRAKPTDPLRRARLLITYDTGGRNLVPHRPDVCYLGAGYAPAQAHENLVVDVPRLPPDLASLPIRVCTFVKTALRDHEKVSVIYTFNANGRFMSDPYHVRIAINAPTVAHAYFSKVEVSFPGATRSQTIIGAKKLFDVILPALVADHWPDFAKAENDKTMK